MLTRLQDEVASLKEKSQRDQVRKAQRESRADVQSLVSRSCSVCYAGPIGCAGSRKCLFGSVKLRA